MTCYLLIPALISGMVALQTGNVTDGLSNREAGTLRENNTFPGILKPPNVTSASYAEHLNRLEEELEQLANSRVNVTMEDNENFQDQEYFHPHMHCNTALLVDNSHTFCGTHFHKMMSAIGTENWCSFDDTIGPYNYVALCLELLSSDLSCYYPNPAVQDFFVRVHSQYFGNCSEMEMLSDAPQGVVAVLTLVPVGLIPVLVFLVVWKSNVRE